MRTVPPVAMEGAGDGAPEDDLSWSLLDAKLTAPRVRSGTVSRRAVIDSARSSGRRIVGITAPAGYGKTTLLAEWAESEDRPVGWVSLDRFDDDPAALLFVMAAAFVALWPTDDGLLADMRGVGTSVLGRAAPRLASAFRSSPGPVRPHGGRSPRSAVPGLPRRAGHGHGRDAGPLTVRRRQPSRTAAPGPHAGHRARPWRSRLPIWPSTRMAPSRSSSTADVDLTPELADTVMERTEGWPVGLYLAATIARDSSDTALAISGDDRFVADYLYQESFARQPEAIQHFLRRTSVLDHLSRPALRCRPRRLERAGPPPGPRGLQPVPGAARPAAGVVSLPRAVPRVPRQRAPPRRARTDPEAPSPRRRLVRSQRLPRASRWSTSSTPTNGTAASSSSPSWSCRPTRAARSRWWSAG